MRFNAEMSSRTIIVSVLFYLFTVFDLLLIIYIIARCPSRFTSLWALGGVIILSLMLLPFAQQVIAYEVSDQGLKIIRRWREKSWSIHQIVELDLSRLPFKGSIRIFGIGGVLGFYGKFRHRDGRYFWAYATDSRDAILIKTETFWIAISPRERELLLDELGRFAPYLLK